MRQDYDEIVRASSESKAGNTDQQRFINKRTEETKALQEVYYRSFFAAIAQC
jgi:hypothetical protein